MTAATTGDVERVLTVAARGAWLALPLACVVETMRPLRVTALRGAPPFVLGVALVRGRPTPVVDASLLLAPGAPAAAATRFVSLRAGDRRVALAVEAVGGLCALPRGAFEALPWAVAREGASPFEAAGAAGDALLVLLRAARVVTPDVWALLDASRGAP